MTTDVRAPETSAVLKTLGDPLRWRIVQLLAVEELCVCHLVEELEVPQPLVSHHLRALRQAGVVEASRYRQWVYYRLDAAVLAAVATEVRATARGAAQAARHRRPCC